MGNDLKKCDSSPTGSKGILPPHKSRRMRSPGWIVWLREVHHIATSTTIVRSSFRFSQVGWERAEESQHRMASIITRFVFLLIVCPFCCLTYLRRFIPFSSVFSSIFLISDLLLFNRLYSLIHAIFSSASSIRSRKKISSKSISFYFTKTSIFMLWPLRSSSPSIKALTHFSYDCVLVPIMYVLLSHLSYGVRYRSKTYPLHIRNITIYEE